MRNDFPLLEVVNHDGFTGGFVKPLFPASPVVVGGADKYVAGQSRNTRDLRAPLIAAVTGIEIIVVRNRIFSDPWLRRTIEDFGILNEAGFIEYRQMQWLVLIADLGGGCIGKNGHPSLHLVGRHRLSCGVRKRNHFPVVVFCVHMKPKTCLAAVA